MSRQNDRVEWLFEPTEEELNEHANDLRTIHENLVSERHRITIFGSSFLAGGDPRVPFGFVAVDMRPMRFVLPSWMLVHLIDEQREKNRPLGEILLANYPGTSSIESSISLLWLRFVAKGGTTVQSIVSDRVAEGGAFGLLLTTTSSIYLFRSGFDGEVRALTHAEVLSIAAEMKLKELYRLELIEPEEVPI